MAIYKIKQHFPVGRTFLSGMLETGRQECLPYHKRYIKLSMTKSPGYQEKDSGIYPGDPYEL